jgi:Tol biopolymer transport system component
MRTMLAGILGVWLSVGVAFAAEIRHSAAGHVFNPTWAPDGRWLSFEVNDYEGTNDLYVVEMMSGSAKGAPSKAQLPGARSSFSSGGTVSGAAVWHPQGALIFEGSNAGGTTRLFLLSPGTQGASELITGAQIKGDLSWPAISPDGRRVVFVSDISGSGDIHVWDRGTNSVTRMLTSPFSEMAPSFHSDGEQIAYSRKNRGGEDMFVLQGANSRPWVGGTGDQSRPIWAGDTILFFSNERGDDQWDIASSATVGAKTVLAKNIRLPLRAQPALSPDAQWVSYGVSDPEQSHKIFLSKVDGSRTIRIDTDRVAAGEPSVVTVDGQTFLAFTALPKAGADWRQLHVINITNQLP